MIARKTIVIFLFLCALNSHAQPAVNKSVLTFTIIPAPENTWGYDVYADGRLAIHQPSIPCLPGNKAFKSKEDATKTAQLVISKMNAGQMPPIVTIKDLKTLKIIH